MSEQARDLLDFFRNKNRRSVEVSLTSLSPAELNVSNVEARTNLNVGTYAAGASTFSPDFRPA
jgi:hypothetical protein